jgi:hypothetical protein
MFWGQNDRMKRLVANSGKRWCGSERSPAAAVIFGTFKNERPTGSCCTQKTFDRIFKELSIDLQGFSIRGITLE